MEIKKIIAPYLGLTENEISASTNISKKALKSSIFLHRMYGKLLEAGYEIADYSNIETYGSLENIINGASIENEKQIVTSQTISPPVEFNNTTIGIDIQEINELPIVNDFRTDGFYIDNFTEKEISYCILQKNSHASFAGLFAVKEAIIKADNSFINTKFNTIEIKHNEKGKPYYDGFAISISHNKTSAISAAVCVEEKQKNIYKEQPVNATYNIIVLLISIVAIVLSCVALFFKR